MSRVVMGSGFSRDLMGFKDGTVNPTAPEAGDLVWTAVGGSCQVVRMIRMFAAFCDRISLAGREHLRPPPRHRRPARR